MTPEGIMCPQGGCRYLARIESQIEAERIAALLAFSETRKTCFPRQGIVGD